MEERIRARLADLTDARSAYVQETARQLMGFDAAIGELQALLAADEPAATPEDQSVLDSGKPSTIASAAA
jgi:hypothetical protein